MQKESLAALPRHHMQTATTVLNVSALAATDEQAIRA